MTSCTYPAGSFSATNGTMNLEAQAMFNGKRENSHVVGFRRMTTPSSVASKKDAWSEAYYILPEHEEVRIVEMVQRSWHLSSLHSQLAT